MFDRLLNKYRSDERKRLGRWGEKRCEKFLKSKGLKLIARNFSCKTGEIDLIMADTEGTIVFVEVKTRADESFTPVESVITLNKKTKMFKTARYFLASYNIINRPYRFDVVAITADQPRNKQIRHYENAFVR